MEKQSTPRLRAAPSPTGYVHIGNLRTFLYSFLYRKQNDGEFILRIEDTDQKRKVEKGTEAIIEILKLYGIEFDEGPIQGGDFGPYIQTERLELYRDSAEKLINEDKAYRCFCSEERLEQMREDQKKSGDLSGYDGLCRTIPSEESEERAKSEKYVVRMKFPKEGSTTFQDLVYGEVTVPNDTIDDQVLLKSNGLPTYHFAVVVDDHMMGITHVVRGREYLADTPKNIFLYDAFGWDIPNFIHVPHILKPVGKGKLGKRDGALPALGYLKKGYLPEGVLNYIALIGWSPDPKKAKQSEIYSIEELVDIFDFDGIQKAGGRYDPKKLDNTNGKHIRELSVGDLTESVINWAENIVLSKGVLNGVLNMDDWEKELEESITHYLPLWMSDINYFKNSIALVQERLTYFAELPKLLDFFYDDDLEWSDSDWKTKDRDYSDVAEGLEGIYPKLEKIFSDGDFSDHDSWERVVRGYADEIGWKHGEMFLAIRSATTGRLQSPPLLESFQVMGWERVSKNFKDAISWLKAN